MLQGSGSQVGALAPCCITPDFLHPLVLPAKFLSATDEDLMLETEEESSSSDISKSGSNQVWPPPSEFQDMS